MIQRYRSFVVLLGLLCVAPASAHAQSLVGAGATVPVASPTGIGVRNLAFGAVTPVAGVTQTISIAPALAPQSAAAYGGYFSYNVTGAAGLDFTIGVPAALTSTIGGLTIPVTFNGTQYGTSCVMEGGGPCTNTSFNPGAGATQTVCRGYRGNGSCMTNRVWPAGSQLHVLLGGQVSVPPTAAAATYTGVITMTIVQVY